MFAGMIPKCSNMSLASLCARSRPGAAVREGGTREGWTQLHCKTGNGALRAMPLEVQKTNLVILKTFWTHCHGFLLPGLNTISKNSPTSHSTSAQISSCFLGNPQVKKKKNSRLVWRWSPEYGDPEKDLVSDVGASFQEAHWGSFLQ